MEHENTPRTTHVQIKKINIFEKLNSDFPNLDMGIDSVSLGESLNISTKWTGEKVHWEHETLPAKERMSPLLRFR